MNYHRVNNVGLHWRQDGDPSGQPVVFANSLGTDLRIWEQVVERMPQNLRLIRYDKRGHGLSSCPDGPYSIAELAGDVSALLEALRVKDCIFVGLSIGGMIAQQLAHSRPDLVRGMVLSNTAARMGSPDMWSQRIAAVSQLGLSNIAGSILERWFAPAFCRQPELDMWRNMLLRTPQVGYIACCEAIARADLSDQTATLKLPTLAIAGSDDGSSPADLVEATSKLIPNSEFKCIDGVGHLPCIEKPDVFAMHLSRFIQEVTT